MRHSDKIAPWLSGSNIVARRPVVIPETSREVFLKNLLSNAKVDIALTNNGNYADKSTEYLAFEDAPM
jgi:hypothetical protein